MKKLISVTLALFSGMCAFTASGQESSKPGVYIYGELRPDNSLSVMAEPSGYGTFTVDIEFSETANTTADGKARVIVPGGDGAKEVLRLRPDDPSQPAAAEFTWNWLQGKVDAPADPDFVYRLPFPNGMSSVPGAVSGTDTARRDRSRTNYKAWQFPLPAGTPVYPVRAGQVIRIEGFEGVAGNGRADSGNNYVTIEHADGTQARYMMLEKLNAGVAEGAKVYPGTPIATAGTMDGQDYGVRVSIHYYIADEGPRPSQGMAAARYLDPVFSTTGGDKKITGGEQVTSRVTKQLVYRENPRNNFFKRLFSPQPN